MSFACYIHVKCRYRLSGVTNGSTILRPFMIANVHMGHNTITLPNTPAASGGCADAESQCASPDLLLAQQIVAAQSPHPNQAVDASTTGNSKTTSLPVSFLRARQEHG